MHTNTKYWIRITLNRNFKNKNIKIEKKSISFNTIHNNACAMRVPQEISHYRGKS